MYYVLLPCCLVVLVSASDQEISQTAISAFATLEEEWADYKRVWGKQYFGLEENRR